MPRTNKRTAEVQPKHFGFLRLKERKLLLSVKLIMWLLGFAFPLRAGDLWFSPHSI